MKNNTLKSILTLSLSTLLFVSVLTPAALAAGLNSPAPIESTGPVTAAAGKARRGANMETAPGRGTKEEAAEPANAIGKDAAIDRALAKAGISAAEAGDITVYVRKLDDGAVVYCVHYSLNGQRTSTRVDAISGEILCTGTLSGSYSAGQGSAGRGRGEGSRKSSGANQERVATV